MGNSILMYESYPSGLTSVFASSDNSNTDRIFDGMTTLAWKNGDRKYSRRGYERMCQ